MNAVLGESFFKKENEKMKNGKRRKIVERKGGEKAKIGEVKISLSLYLRRD